MIFLFNNIIEFLDNGYIVYNINTLTKQNLREHLNTAIKEFKRLYDNDNGNKTQPLIMTISDTINYLRDGITKYIKYYNNIITFVVYIVHNPHFLDN